MAYVSFGTLSIADVMYNFVNDELLAGLEINPNRFWSEFEIAVNTLTPKNRALLQTRDTLQKKLDKWLNENKLSGIDPEKYTEYLKEIGYLLPKGEDFEIETSGVDEEISKIAGPQLVVPVMNARYALNAANARWGSLYDALYGTDVISEDDGSEKSEGYNPIRGKKVIEYARGVLDAHSPLKDTTWRNVTSFSIINEKLVIFADQKSTTLRNDAQFVGYCGVAGKPNAILLVKNKLHIEILIKPDGVIGKTDKAGIDNVIVESAISTIMDCEDSVAAVDSEDKVLAYRNWLGLMRGDLSVKMEKRGETFTRKLNEDKIFTAPNGDTLTLHGRSLMLVRNVGHLMTNPAILLGDKSEIPEGIMDSFMTVLGAMYDFKTKGNSKTNSIYIVKPKMHGPEEVAFTCEIFDMVETILKLPTNTAKIGIMDEERRTTVNLKECIRAAKKRVAFINTGFLDRTGDEIHTSMSAGAMIRKTDMKQAAWISAYENWNVDVGLSCGFSGKAQIGKGMWAMPDLMDEMMKQKIGHPKAGANCAWVPSPTAATLHALHYHHVNVFQKHAEISKRKHAELADILTIPTAQRPNWSDKDIQQELENNAQGILGYVVRWIDQGVGCSKVPDIHNVGLMEDRATLRISSQHMANWIHHGICTKDQVMLVMKKMALVVDKQNEMDAQYEPMGENFDSSIAFQAACELIFEGLNQPAGYTEPILHRRRLEKKSAL